MSKQIRVKRGRARCHAKLEGSIHTLCGLNENTLQLGSKRFFWIGQVSCKNCKRAMKKGVRSEA